MLGRLAADPALGVGRVIDKAGIAVLGGGADADFFVDAKIGYAMAAGLRGPLVSPGSQRGTHGYFPEHPEMRATLMQIDEAASCIMCASCTSSCPSFWADDDYIGPAALLKAYRFEVDTRDEARKERLPLFDNERGVYRCHTITNCGEACPKELNPTEGIQWLKKSAVRRRLLGRWK